jgi:probable HAF family extracellular repeat protein
MALAATLQPTVTLASGATAQSIPITIDATNYIIPANTTLQVLAVSQNDPNAQALITATVTIGPTQSVSAAILPNATFVTYPATNANLLFDAINTGNIADTYKAQITGTSGPVTASLVSNGQSVQSIPSFYASARGTAQFPLNAVVSGSGVATVTVTVTSLSNAAVTSSALVTINPEIQCDVNKDNTDNAQDVQLMIDQALGTATPLYDLNGDGVVNVVDVEIDIDAALGEGCLAAVGALSTATAHLSTASPRSGTTAVAVTPNPIGTRAAQPYRITDLGTLGGSFSAAHGINNSQQVVGESEIGKQSRPVRHAFLWEAGYMTDLGPPGISLDSVAYAINDTGQAAVVVSYPEHTESFRYAAGAATPVALESRVRAINNAGQLVGNLDTSGAFLWNSGVSTDLGGAGSQAYAINDLGQIVGAAYLTGNSTRHAFLFNGAALTDLGTLGGAESVAFGINNAGQIVGASQATVNGPDHAFLYSGWSMTDLGTLGGPASQADAINRGGLVVGWAQTFTGEQHAFLWNSGKMVDLNSLVTLEQGAVLIEATAINDAGQIVANGSNGRAYLIQVAM